MKFRYWVPVVGLGMVLTMAHNESVPAQNETPPAPAHPAPKKRPDPNDAFVPTWTVLYKTVQDARNEKRQVELYLNVFEPAGHKATDKTPVIVYFFGGGWINGEPKAFFSQCDYFQSRGIVAISADYRTFSRHSTTPFECVTDGKSVIRYIRARATELGVDPQRIVAAGS